MMGTFILILSTIFIFQDSTTVSLQFIKIFNLTPDLYAATQFILSETSHLNSCHLMHQLIKGPLEIRKISHHQSQNKMKIIQFECANVLYEKENTNQKFSTRSIILFCSASLNSSLFPSPILSAYSGKEKEKYGLVDQVAVGLCLRSFLPNCVECSPITNTYIPE